MAVYLFMASISLTGFWLYYYLVLRNKTFFKLNRVYLLVTLIFSLLIPLVYHLMPMNESIQRGVEVIPFGQQAVSSVRNVKTELVEMNPSNNNNFTWVITVYQMICALLAFRFLWGAWSIYRLKSKAEAKQVVEGITIFYVSTIQQPFSVGVNMFMPASWRAAIPQEVFEHEKAHITQRHICDVLLTEIAAIVLWFNPFVYAYKNSIKLNLEYLADRAVIGQGTDVLGYQSLLLNYTLQKETSSSLVLHFISPLKNRLTMMNKQNSKLWQRLLIIGAIPLAALLMALNVKEEVRKPVKYVFSPFAFQDQDSEIPNRSPFDTNAKVKITAKFGMRMHPILKYKKMHTGVDISAKKGTPIYATADGFVTYAKDDGDWGNHVQIKHSDKYITTYAHLNDFRVLNGELVKKGQLIGHVGTTGKSMGPHLHYEVYEDGKAIDPEKFIGGC